MLQISQQLITQIWWEAEKAYPNECCGFIFGVLESGEKKAELIKASGNSSSAAEQYHRFKISAEEMMQAEIYARRSSLDIVGFYHSHPDCAAVPSEYDTAHALPVYSYLIVSAVKGKAVETTSWELDDNKNYKHFKQELIQTEERSD